MPAADPAGASARPASASISSPAGRPRPRTRDPSRPSTHPPRLRALAGCQHPAPHRLDGTASPGHGLDQGQPTASTAQPRPPDALAGAPTGRPARPAAPPRAPAPDRRGGGGRGAPTGAPHCVRSAHTTAQNFELPEGHNSPARAERGVTANRPKPDRAQPPPHPVRAITLISAL